MASGQTLICFGIHIITINLKKGITTCNSLAIMLKNILEGSLSRLAAIHAPQPLSHVLRSCDLSGF